MNVFAKNYIKQKFSALTKWQWSRECSHFQCKNILRNTCGGIYYLVLWCGPWLSPTAQSHTLQFFAGGSGHTGADSYVDALLRCTGLWEMQQVEGGIVFPKAAFHLCNCCSFSCLLPSCRVSQCSGVIWHSQLLRESLSKTHHCPQSHLEVAWPPALGGPAGAGDEPDGSTGPYQSQPFWHSLIIHANPLP